MRGRKPKPTRLKIVEGNPGKRPLNTNEPKPHQGMPIRPDYLNDIASQEWDRVAPELHRLGLLTALDVTPLACYCLAYKRWRQAEELILKEGITKVNHRKQVVSHPAVPVVNQSLKQIREFCSEFGMTPSSRCRIKLPPPKFDIEDLLK